MEARKAPPVTSVPFLDLAAAHEGLKGQIIADIADLADTNAFINGPAVADFERSFAEYCGTATSIGLASGLDAIRLGLLAAGAEAGDEVIVPANTFVATLEGITQAGCRPVVVDASLDDLNLDVDAAAAAVGPRTRFVVPVHLYGQMADMAGLRRTMLGTGVEIVEDACQAHGAERDGIRAGSSGRAAAFSFYPGKNLGAWGDAGALTTDDAELALKVRALREHGQTRKYHHEWEGYTARLDTVQALVLLRKLPLLDGWNVARRDAAAFYDSALDGVGDIQLPPVPDGSEPVWHLYVIQTGRRDDLAGYLGERGISTGLHYPEPVHLSPAYRSLGYAHGAFPVAEQAAERVLSLPMYPGIGEAQLETVAAAIVDCFSDGL